MIIASQDGLAVQGSGSSDSNYGVRQISKSTALTYAQGTVDLLTITASGSASTNFTISTYYTWNAENQSNPAYGPSTIYYQTIYYLNSSGFFVSASTSAIIGQGNAFCGFDQDFATSRTIKYRSYINNSSYPNATITLHLSVSCTDFSLLTFS